MNMLNEISMAWSAWILRASLQGAVAIVVALVICLLIRKSSCWAQCWLWRLAFVKLLVLLIVVVPIRLPILPALPSSVSQLSMVNADPSANSLAAKLTAPISPALNQRIEIEFAPIDTARITPPAAAQLPVIQRIAQVLFTMWLIGVAVGLLWIVAAWAAAARLRRQLNFIADSNLNRCCENLATAFNLAHAPKLASSTLTDSPLLIGAIRPVIVFPAAMVKELDDQQLALVMAHELSHLKRKDLWWSWIPAMAQVVFFFHPLVWIAARCWRLAREMACDELVLSATQFSPAAYAETLLHVSAGAEQPHFTSSMLSTPMASTSQSLKRRLVAMSYFTQDRRLSIRSSRLGVLVAIVAILAIVPWQPVPATAVSAALAEEGESEDPIPKEDPVAKEDPTPKKAPIPNLGFETAKESGWPQHYFGGGPGYSITVDSEFAHSGKRSGKITFVGDGAGDSKFGTCAQRIDATPFRGKRVAYRGFLKSELLDGGKSGLWMRVDERDSKQSIAFDNMLDRAITGSNDWKQYEIVLDVADTAAFINIGFLVVGPGAVWADDLSLVAVGKAGEGPALTRRVQTKPQWGGNARNLDFEVETVDGADGARKDMPLHYFGGGPGYSITTDSEFARGGKRSGKITFVGEEPRDPNFGTCAQHIDAKPFRGKRVAYRGFLKTELLDGGDAGLWMRVDGDETGQSIAFDNMMDRAITGSSDWTQYEIVLDVAETAKFINIGFLVRGPGAVWADDLSLVAVGKAGEGPALTGRVGKAPSRSNDVSDDTPSPLNLDFEDARDDGSPSYYHNGGVHLAKVDSATFHGGKQSCRMSSKDDESGVGTLFGVVNPKNYHGKRVAFRGFLKSSLGDDSKAGLWMRIDDESGSGVLDNMMDRPVEGTSEWREYTIVLDVPKSAKRISYGLLMIGTGDVWCDDFTLTAVSEAGTGPALTSK